MDWCFLTAYGVNAAYKLLCQPQKSCGAGCAYSAQYYKSKGRWHDSDPRPGDQIFFWPKDNIGGTSMQHTGLVVAVDSTYVYTVEGNTSSDSGVVWNGGSVNDKKYKLSYERIAGYGRPDYEHVTPDEGDEQFTGTETTEKIEEDKTMVTGQAWVKVSNGSTVNYRQRPTTSAAKVVGCNTIKNGEEVYIKESDGTWAAVEYNGHQGYVMMTYLTTENPERESAAEGSERTADQIVAEITVLLQELAMKAK